jgi:hypothetical protein
MRKFLVHATLFSTLSIVCLALLFEWLFLPDGDPRIVKHLRFDRSWLDVYQRVQESAAQRSYPLLILGDSTAGQLFPFGYRDGYLTSNGSVYSAGNYLLCMNVIKNNPELKYVLYLSVPKVIGHQFERNRTCSNFVKPFYELATLNALEPATKSAIETGPFTFLYRFKLVKCLPVDDFQYFRKPIKTEYLLSPFSLLYMQKLRDLCAANGIQLLFLSPPIPSGAYATYKRYEKQMVKAISRSGLEWQFRYYFKTMRSIPPADFRDGLHFSQKYLLANRWPEIKRIADIAEAGFGTEGLFRLH